MKSKLKNLEVWFKLALVVIFALLYRIAIPYPADSRQFPQLIALFALAVLAVSLILDFVKKKAVALDAAELSDVELKGAGESAKRDGRRRFYLTWVIVLISTAVGFWGGFIFSIFLMFMGFAILFGKKKQFLRNTGYAVLMTVLIYLTFQWLMGVPLLGN